VAERPPLDLHLSGLGADRKNANTGALVGADLESSGLFPQGRVMMDPPTLRLVLVGDYNT
jgi:hypothetical protein